MPLTCWCDDFDYYANHDEDFSEAQSICKCESCKRKIQKGETVLKFTCFRDPDEDSEDPEEIQAYEDGDYFHLPDEFMCERCGEIYLNLKDTGYCLSINEYMPGLLRYYQQMTGFDPEKYAAKDEK